MTSPVPVLGTATLQPGQRQLIYGSHGSNAGPITLINLSTTVTASIGYDQTIMVGSGPVIPLMPGASLSFDGTVTVYGIAPDNCQIAVVPGGTGYSQPASQITSIVQNGSLSGGSVFTIPAGGVGNTVTLLPMTDISAFASCDVAMYAWTSTPGVTDSSAGYGIEFSWYDDLVSGIPVFTETWWGLMGAAANANASAGVRGSMPMHGRYMMVTAVQADGSTGTASVQYFNLFGSPRTVPYSDLRQNGGVVGYQDSFFANPGVAAFTDTDDNWLLRYENTMPASASWMLPVGMYSGPVFSYMSQIVAFSSFGGVVPLINALCGRLEAVVTSNMNQPVYTWAAGAGTVYAEYFAPRAAHMLLVHGNVGGTSQFACSFVAQQAA